jgi:phage shock protein A
MSIFSRFADIINSNINALLDKAEEPEKLIRMIIQEMEDTLVEVRTESAKALADRKELQRKLSWLQKEIADWVDKAELALGKGRDDLAKAALVEKNKLEQELRVLEQQRSLLDESIDKLTQEIAQLQDKLTDARARQSAIKMRFATQSSRVKVNRKLYELNSGNVVQKFERFERKLDELEGEADSFKLARNHDLRAKFDELEESEKVDQELEQLKQKLAKKDSNSASNT